MQIKKQVFEEDLLVLADEQQSVSKLKHIDLLDISIKCGSNQRSLARVQLKYLNKTREIELEGTGPIDAVFKAIKTLITTKAHLAVYQVNAITKGTDAQAEVSVRLEEDGVSVLGTGNDIDTIVASGKAYINGLNKLINKKSKAKDSKKILNPSNRTIDKHVI